jgi:hypothetical protein
MEDGNFNRPSFEWLKFVYSLFSRKYKKNLKAMYVVHPTMWTKVIHDKMNRHWLYRIVCLPHN